MICFQQWSPPRLSSIKSTLAQTVMDGAIDPWCTLTLEFTSNLFGSCLFGYHLYYLSLRFDINFPLEATSREVGYSPVDLKLLNNMCNCSHRNIKLLEDGLITFTFNMLVYHFLSDLLRQISAIAFSGPCSVWCTLWYQSDWFDCLKTPVMMI